MRWGKRSFFFELLWGRRGPAPWRGQLLYDSLSWTSACFWKLRKCLNSGMETTPLKDGGVSSSQAPACFAGTRQRYRRILPNSYIGNVSVGSSWELNRAINQRLSLKIWGTPLFRGHARLFKDYFLERLLSTWPGLEESFSLSASSAHN